MRAMRFCAFLVAALIAHSSAHSIKHVIVLMEENRSFDHLLGWRSGINGVNKDMCNFVDPQDPSKGKFCVTDKAPNVAPCDPDHDLPPTTQKIFGPKAFYDNNLTDPTMSGFVAFEHARGEARTNSCLVMDLFSVEHLPVMNAMADEFVLFDNFFAALPGPTWPNRIFFLSGTSGGLTETSNPWFLGQTGVLFPQRTIFDQVRDAGLTWKNYVNDTPWELMMESIAHNSENVVLLEELFKDAREGTLPNFAFVNPRAGVNLSHGYGSNDMHPDHDVALGEQYYKDIYEALRASPQWNDTLFIVTFDEHGGFYDHVPTPMHCPAPGDGIPSYPDQFDFDRLGMRIATLLLSPWVPKGEVISDPPASVKPSPDSQYSLTSIIATVRKILNISEGNLTARDGWSATFEHILDQLPEPRTDCPTHLPDAMKPQITPQFEAKQPLNGLQQHFARVHSNVAGVPYPDHIKTQGSISEWLQDAFAVHKKRTAAWKASKKELGGTMRPKKVPRSKHAKPVTASAPVMSTALTVMCEPFIGMTPPYLASNWSVSLNNTAKFRTISTPVQALGRTTQFCLDGGDMTSGARVGISHCYPSADPAVNRDVSQQWVRVGGTIRPFQNQDLCLANTCLDDSPTAGLKSHISLAPCTDSLAQHWAWQGGAPGNVGYADEGMLANGDAIYAMVVDWNKASKHV